MRKTLRAYLLAFGIAGALLGAGQLAAEPVAADSKAVVTAPNWVVGSNWYYSDGYALKVTASTPQETIFDRLDAPGQWFSRQGFLRKDLTSGTATRTSVFRTISDQAGLSLRAASPLTFQREYLENGALVVHASSWSVEGRETITVPAGTFDCWLIVWRSRSLRSNWTGFERWWYSPQAQNYVRMEYKYGPDSEGSRVLMRYQIGAQAADSSPATPLQPLSMPAAIAPANPIAAGLPQAPADAGPVAKAPPAAHAENPPAAPAASLAADHHAAIEKPAEAPQTAAIKAVSPSTATMKTASSQATAMPAQTPGRNVWHAQVASSKEEAAIHKSFDKILASHADMLKDVPGVITTAQVGARGVFYRAWLGNFDRSADAAALCGRLQAGGIACSVAKSARTDAQQFAAKS